jgi:hypothetical protein
MLITLQVQLNAAVNETNRRRKLRWNSTKNTGYPSDHQKALQRELVVVDETAILRTYCWQRTSLKKKLLIDH